MKKRMSSEKFRTITLPLIAVVAVLSVALPIAANTYSGQLDMVLGKGQRHVQEAENVSKEAAEYYKAKFDNPTAGTLQNQDPPTEIEEKSRNEASKTALKVAEEGVTLLKNDGVLPLSRDSKVTPFGYRYISPIWGGSGSAATNMNFDYVVTAEEALEANYSINDQIVNKMKQATPLALKADTTKAREMSHFSDSGSSDMTIYEYDPSIYTGVETSCNGTTGIVFVGRLGLEGDDMYSDPYQDGTANHSLQLTKEEKDTIEYAKRNCDKVIVICNFSNIMEIGDLKDDEKIDAILWIGNPGSKGLQALTEILAGDVNPSGRIVDTWIRDLTKDPTWVNTLDGKYTNEELITKNFYEYEEGIYAGYRYYETADKEKASGNYTDFQYDKEVVYPFGYGLHYDSDKISQKLDRVKVVGETLTVKGTITNNSTRDVKETVQLYNEAPYYKEGSKIEKSAKVLVDFDKVFVKANTTEEFTFAIPLDELSSYDDNCYYSKNGSYVLEKGTYTLHLGKNAHEDYDSESFNVNETLAYTDSTALNGAKASGKRKSDGVTAENQFKDINNYIKDTDMTLMSRSDFKGSWPSEPSTSKIAPDYAVKENAAYDNKNDPISGSENKDALLYKSEKPVSKADNGLTLSSLRGLSYDDPLWDDLLDQIDFDKKDDISSVITYGLYMTQPLDSIGLVRTGDNDGPLGLTATWSGTQGHVVACAYSSAPLTAATWNTDLIREMGEAIGQEGLTNNINGWYGPAVNLHRSAFGGRNFEYYSEDPVLSGKIGAAMVSGSREQGLFAHLKHFALNEMDHDRGKVQVYASEQSMREMYLKPFEIATKEAECVENVYDGTTGGQKQVSIKATGAYMTSMSFIGPKFSASSYQLLTTVLRDEWGFEGFCLTDFTSGANKSKDCGYRVGNDVWMGMRKTDLQDLDTATAQWAARKAIKNLSYTVVNSAAYNHVAPGSYAYYDKSPWRNVLLGVEITAGVLLVLSIALVVLREIDNKRHPELYIQGGNEND